MHTSCVRACVPRVQMLACGNGADDTTLSVGRYENSNEIEVSWQNSYKGTLFRFPSRPGAGTITGGWGIYIFRLHPDTANTAGALASLFTQNAFVALSPAIASNKAFTMPRFSESCWPLAPASQPAHCMPGAAMARAMHACVAWHAAGCLWPRQALHCCMLRHHPTAEMESVLAHARLRYN